MSMNFRDMNLKLEKINISAKDFIAKMNSLLVGFWTCYNKDTGIHCALYHYTYFVDENTDEVFVWL